MRQTNDASFSWEYHSPYHILTFAFSCIPFCVFSAYHSSYQCADTLAGGCRSTLKQNETQSSRINVENILNPFAQPPRAMHGIGH